MFLNKNGEIRRNDFLAMALLPRLELGSPASEARILSIEIQKQIKRTRKLACRASVKEKRLIFAYLVPAGTPVRR